MARWTRRTVIAAVTITMLAYPFLLTDPRSPWANLDKSEFIRLYSDGVSGSGSRLPTMVPAGSTADYLPGSRVLHPGPADADALAALGVTDAVLSTPSSSSRPRKRASASAARWTVTS